MVNSSEFGNMRNKSGLHFSWAMQCLIFFDILCAAFAFYLQHQLIHLFCLLCFHAVNIVETQHMLQKDAIQL